jgi:hypothetical protein
LTIREALSDEVAYAPSDYMITRRIPYQIRWKIMHLKLLLNDIKDIAEKHDIPAASELYQTMRYEANSYLSELNNKMMRRKRGKDDNSL